MTDHDLLRQFVRDRDERSFGELVCRHIDLVYSAARRQIREPAAVEDVAQKVFIRLAEKAHTIRDGQALGGWLLVTTRSVALNMLRDQARRRLHEEKAGAMKLDAQVSDSEPEWDAIQPALDDAVAQLKPADRDALTLRYFQNMSLADVGTALGISQRAAQKRVHRAIDRLRRIFARQGITTGSVEALTVVLAKNAVASAPQTMAEQISRSALMVAAPIKKGLFFATAGAKLLAGAAAVIVIAAGISVIAIVLQRSTVQQVVAQNAPPTTREAWRADFEAVYFLADGEILKRIRPPFIPERRDYMASRRRADFNPDFIVFGWNGIELAANIWGGGAFSFGEMLQNVVGIYPPYLDMPRERVLARLSDDWIVRTDASRADKAAKFAELADEVVGPGMTLVPALVEREVIVVRGKFKFVTHPNILPDTLATAEVHLFTDEPGKPGTRKYGGFAPKVEELFQYIGTMLVWPVVTEIEPPDNTNLQFRFTAHESAMFMRSEQPASAEVVDQVLANIAKQTSLELKREKRTVTMWRLVPKASG